MKKLVVIVAMVLLLLCWHSTSFASTYYASPTGSGSTCAIDSPCTLSTMLGKLVAGDNAYLRGGNYSISNAGGVGIGLSDITGDADNVTTISAYTGETPVLYQDAPNATNGATAVRLDNCAYIKVTGITFNNFTAYWLYVMGGSSYNEISYNIFETLDVANYPASSTLVKLGGDDTTAPWSTNNWVHHNYFSKVQSRLGPCTEALDLMTVGHAASGVPVSQHNNNTVEDNYMEYASHSVLAVNTLYNIVRRNIIHNEPWKTGCTNWQTGTSVTSLAIGTGSKTLTTNTGLNLTTYPRVTIAYQDNMTHAMYGTVTSYNSGTGELVVNVTKVNGSGTYASWYISNRANTPHFSGGPYDNNAYDGKVAHRNVTLGGNGSQYSDDYYSLFENNRVGFGGMQSSINDGNVASANVDASGHSFIIRHNYLYGAQSSGIYMKWVNVDTNRGGINNRIFNNTIYFNGAYWDQSIYMTKNSDANTTGIHQNCTGSCTAGSTLNVMKNNLLYNNGGDICANQILTQGASCTASTYDTVTNNWVHANGDPSFSNPSMADPTSQNLFASVHGYTATPIPDLSLTASSSGLLDNGTYLTIVHTDDTGSGTTLIVSDALYFQAGSSAATTPMGSALSSVAGDYIAVGTVGNTVQITDINYSTNTITLASGISRSDGDAVWLYKNSSGTQVLYGSAPDTGAYEYSDADATPSAFSYTNVTNAALSAETTTNPCATIGGIDAGQTPAITISGTGCTYNIDAGAYTANAGTVGLDNVVCLRGTSSASYSTTYPSCTLTIGGVNNTGAPWTVRTLDAVADPVAPRMRAGSMSGGWK